MWYVYIIHCNDGSLYTGVSTDPQRRLKEHESGKRGAKYLRGKGPLELVYTASYSSRSFAQSMEFHIKKMSKDRKEALCQQHQ